MWAGPYWGGDGLGGGAGLRPKTQVPGFTVVVVRRLVESMGWFRVKVLLLVSQFLASSARAPTPVLSAHGKQTVL